ncbi:WXG100-like domain-containing protein, partial [Amycolatopsis japonica]
MLGADETTHLPPELQHFFKIVLGMEWPEGSEGGLRAIGHAWGQFGDVAKAALGEFSSVAGQLDRSFDGVMASAILDFVRGELMPGVEELKVRAEGFEKQAKNAAADIQKAKMMLVIFAALTLAAIIQLLSTLFGAIFVPVVEAAARLTIQGILQLLKTKLAQVTVQQVGSGLLKLSSTVAKWAAGGAGLMVFVDFVIQGLQIATDGRDGWDTESLKGSAIGGAIGGAAGGVFHGVAKGAGNFFAKEIRHKLPRGWQKTFDIAYPSAYAIGQVAMVAFSNPLVFLATNDKEGVMWEGILGALSSPGGGKGGGVTGPGATIMGQSFLDKLDQLGLGWLKPATATLPGGGEKPGSDQLPSYPEAADGEPPALEEKKPLVIPEATAAPVSIKDSVVTAAREVVSSAKSLLGTVFGPESSARQVIPTVSTVRSGLMEFLGGAKKEPAVVQVPVTSGELTVGSGTDEASGPAVAQGAGDGRSAAALGNQQAGGGSRGEASGTPAAQQTGSSRPSAVSSGQPTGTVSTPPHSPSQAQPLVGQSSSQGQAGAGLRPDSAAVGQSQNQSTPRAPDVGNQPQTQSRAGGESSSAARTPDRLSTPSFPAATPDRASVTASGTPTPPDRTMGSTPNVTRPSQPAGEPSGSAAQVKPAPVQAVADPSPPRNLSRVDGDGSPRHPGVVKPVTPLSSRDDVGLRAPAEPRTAPFDSATSDGPAPEATPPQILERPAAAAVAPRVGVPVPLSEVVDGLDLSEVDYVPLSR